MEKKFNMHNVNEDNIRIVFYFTRHGHAYSNFMIESSDSLIPWKSLTVGKVANNSMLTDLGIGRSINVGNQMINILPEKYVLMSSPLRRALLTAQYQYNIYRKNNQNIHIIPYINEISNLGCYQIIKKIGIDTNSHNEYDLNDIWYKTNPYNIPFVYDFGRNNLEKEIMENMFSPNPEKFFSYLLNNFYEYKDESKDKNNNHNFVIVSHGEYLNKLFEYLDLKQSISEKIENNSVFRIEMHFHIKCFFRPILRNDLINSVISFMDVTKFNKKVFDIEKLVDKNILSSCHDENGKSINKYIKNTNDYDRIIKILYYKIMNMQVNDNKINSIKIRNEYLDFLEGVI